MTHYELFKIKSTGFYFLTEFEAPGSAIGELEVAYKRDERVMRFLSVRMDADHITYAESRRKRLGAKKSAPAEA